MQHRIPSLLALTLLVASSLSAQAQAGSKKYTLWPRIASANVPNSVNVSKFQDAYYFSPKSGTIMAAASFEWVDRTGKKTIQQQVADTKAYMRANRYQLLARTEKFLSRNRVWTADYQTTETAGEKKVIYITRVRLSKAPKGFVKSEIFGQTSSWNTALFKRTLLPLFNALQVVGLSAPSSKNSS